MQGMNTRRQKLVATLLLLGATTPLAADQSQSHASIRDTARDHALQAAALLPGRPRVEVGSLDSRLRLAKCDVPLEAYDSPNGLNGGRGVVGVRCDGSRPWKLYVPVQLALLEPVVVSRRALVRGQTLGADDLAIDEVDTTTLHKAYFTRIEDVVGLRSKRSVAAGATLHAGLLDREQLVRRGSQVEIVAASGGLQVSMRGKALADGGRGDRIRVENLKSGRVITGTVTGHGVIQVIY